MKYILNKQNIKTGCRNITLLLLFTGGLILLTGCSALFAQSGSTILFISNRVQIPGTEKYPSLQIENQIYRMDGNGNNVKKITDSIGDKQYASFSPDGKKIVFECTSFYAPNPGIYVMDADGENVVRLSANDNQDHEPSWSPDGKWIVFESYRDGNAGIYKMTSDGKTQIRLTQNTGVDWQASWSPDGKQIVYCAQGANSDSPYYQIYLMAADGSHQIALTDTDGDNSNPSWSPDGKKIAFTAIRNGNGQIYVMNADGTNQINLSNNGGNDFSPAWSPNGKYIVFCSSRDSTDGPQNINYEIYRMMADGAHQTRLTDNPASDEFPTWKP
jgi:Tol biopolymer transport system component